MNPLSQRQREQLSTLVSLLQSTFPIDKVFCFGHRTTETAATSCFGSEPAKGSGDHYDLLIVASVGEETTSEIPQFMHDHPQCDRSITAVVHTEISVGNALERGDRFFATVYSEGIPVFSSDPFIIPDWMVAVDWQKACEQAVRSWKVHERRSTGLLAAARTCLNEALPATASFLLAQCLEQTCAGMIAVSLGYRPTTRNLSRLMDLCCNFSNIPMEHFPRDTREEQRLFRVLRGATGGFRYRRNYQVGQGDARQLFENVSAFVKKAHLFCHRELAVLAEEAGHAAVTVAASPTRQVGEMIC